MGGHAMFLGKDDIQLGVNESLYDTSLIISSMTSCMVARVGPHSDVADLAKHSSVPVINALSNDYHPLQVGLFSTNWASAPQLRELRLNLRDVCVEGYACPQDMFKRYQFPETPLENKC
jgi:ornithine carbamoyltransferase